MIKLEEKLLKLGWKQNPIVRHRFIKVIKDIILTIVINDNNEVIETYAVVSITTQEDIDNLQFAFNRMQSDLEVLKKYE